MKTSEVERVLELLKRFNDGKIVNKYNLLYDEMWENVKLRTVERDLAVIKKYFPESYEKVKGAKGEYRAVTQGIFDNFVDDKMLSLMVIAYNLASKNSLFDSFDISEVDKNILKNKIESSSEHFEFITKPFEGTKTPNDLFKNLKFAIGHKRSLQIKYTVNERSFDLLVKPYKIIFINENFYLACESKYSFTMIRIQTIDEIILQKETFHRNLNIIDFIKTIQTPFAKYTEDFRKNMIHVKLQISKEKARFFKLKKFFNSQKIEKANDDGSIVVIYTFTQTSEVLTFVLSWLPHVKVLEPKELKDEVNDILEKAKC